MEKYRARNFVAVLYPEDETHVEAMKKLQSGYKYAAILHNKDIYDEDDTDIADLIGTPKKEHWHCVICFPQARWSSAVAKDLGIAENYLQQCNNLETYLCYLVHMGLPNKAQYDKSEVFGTMQTELERALAKSKTPDERALEVLDIIDDLGPCDMRSVIKACAKNGRYGDLKAMGSWVPYLIAIHNEELEREVDRMYRSAQWSGFLEKGPAEGTPYFNDHFGQDRKDEFEQTEIEN